MEQKRPFYFLNINKPKGITSFDVVYRLRKILNIKKIGHSGTLDPMAQGVMQVAVGDASRLLEYLNSDKEYIADIQFGYTSSTLDCEGDIIKLETPAFNKEDLINEIKNFKGKITQIPPLYSAIKVGGKKLYEFARKGIEVEIPERTVNIYSVKLLEFDNNFHSRIKISCSKGTYIRTLANDIAKRLNTGAYLTGLTRTKAGNFKIENSIEVDFAKEEKNHIEPLAALEGEKYVLSDSEYNLVKNGVSIFCNQKFKCGTIMLVYQNKLVSVGILSDNKIKIKKFFNRV